MDSTQGGVVDDPLGPGHQRGEAAEALHGYGGLPAWLRDPLEVEDHAGVGVLTSHGLKGSKTLIRTWTRRSRRMRRCSSPSFT